MVKKLLLYFPAVITVIIWGSTFLVSKNILSSGIQPITLMTMRFIIAYVILVIFSKGSIKFSFTKASIKQELLFLLLGLSGGSLYFLLEYNSLKLTSAVNVGLISATVPIISTAISLMLRRVKVNYKYYIGSVIAFIGVVLITLNGVWKINISTIGDLLAIASSVLWAIYTVILSVFDNKYPETLISRRLFFYAFITIIGYTIYIIDLSELLSLSDISILFSVLYLSVLASALCIFLWNNSINKIGIIKTNNFLYFLPVVTLISSLLFAFNEITVYSIIGTVFIMIGVFISDKR